MLRLTYRQTVLRNSFKSSFSHRIAMSFHTTNDQARAFKVLHIPGRPLVLANVFDPTSAKLVASLPACKALATASAALSVVNGTDDPSLDLETQLKAVSDIAAVARSFDKPLTVDLQDGYGEQLEEAITAMIGLGVAGVNLEDSDQKTLAVFDEDVAVKRVQRALAAAAKAGVPDFVVNARSDTYLRGGSLDDAIRRGKLFLDAGATTVYILNGKQPMTPEHIKKIVDSLQGKVNIAVRVPKPDAPSELSSKDLADLGVARISIGPQLYHVGVNAMKMAATKVLEI